MSTEWRTSMTACDVGDGPMVILCHGFPETW
jgi:hypothetical protein